MKILWLALLCFPCFASEIFTLDPIPQSTWQTAPITWHFLGKWPAVQKRAMRKMLNTATFKEDPCGVLVLDWQPQQPVFALGPGIIASVSFIEWFISPPAILNCSVVLNATILRKLSKADFAAAINRIVAVILHRNDPTVSRRN